MSVVFLPLAEDELEEAYCFYEQRKRGLGDEFKQASLSALDLVLKHPLAGHEVLPGIRRIILSRFPYALVYQPQHERILVLSVAHLKRRPGYWARRIR